MGIIFNRLKGLGVSLLLGLGQRLLMESPLPGTRQYVVSTDYMFASGGARWPPVVWNVWLLQLELKAAHIYWHWLHAESHYVIEVIWTYFFVSFDPFNPWWKSNIHHLPNFIYGKYENQKWILKCFRPFWNSQTEIGCTWLRSQVKPIAIWEFLNVPKISESFQSKPHDIVFQTRRPITSLAQEA